MYNIIKIHRRINNEKFMQKAKPELIQQTKDRIDEIVNQEKTIKG